MKRKRSNLENRFEESKETTLNLRKLKRQLIIKDLEHEWNELLSEFSRKYPKAINLFPPLEQIKPLAEDMVKDRILNINRIENLEHGGPDYFVRIPMIMGYGKSGVVILKTNDDIPKYFFDSSEMIYKIGTDLDHEYEILNTIKNNHPKYKNYRTQQLPYLREDKCVKNNDKIIALATETKHAIFTLNDSRIIREVFTKEIEPILIHLGKCLFYGLSMMREAGVLYHRDIRPGNILILDYEQTPFDDISLIDFQYATTDRSQPCRKDGNRKFNGLNDVVSAGQVLYDAATGTNLFITTKKYDDYIKSIGKNVFTYTKGYDKTLSDIADEIKTNRDNAYKAEGSIDKKYLKKVDSTVKYDKLGLLIKRCLTAKHDDVEKMYEIFQKVDK